MYKDKNIYILGVIIGLLFIVLIVLINKKCEDKSKKETLNYYSKNDIKIQGIVTGGRYLERNVGILQVKVKKANTKEFISDLSFLFHPKIIIKGNYAEIISGEYKDILINDSIVLSLNEGVFKIYRRDSLIHDIGLKYLKYDNQITN